MYHDIFGQSEVRITTVAVCCQSCCLLCSSYGENRAARTCADFKGGARPGFYLLYSEDSCVSKQYSSTKYNTLLHCKPTLSYIMLMVQRRKECARNGPVAKYNTIFFSNNCQRVTFAKFSFLIRNTARYLKQYLFRVSTQHILVFLSITLNWSTQGYLTLYYLIKGTLFKKKI